LLEIANLPDEEKIVLQSVEGHVLAMALDGNATHVIQKIIVCIEENKRESINATVLANFKTLALDVNGVCVIKKYINSNKSENIKKGMLDQINSGTLELAQSPFGNYVIQQVLNVSLIFNF
jgi:hypothetical protein